MAEEKLGHAGVDEGCLYVIGTPIGNLGDLTPRAAEAFRTATVVCCEDTRVTAKLLANLGVSKPLVRCDENVIAARAPELVERMEAGERVAFASDAGMPGVSDPGQVLVQQARAANVRVEVLPGPTACITALVACGIPCEHFFFEGFLPRKHGERVRRLRRLAAVPGALLFYESPHRTADSLAAIAEVFPRRDAAVARELTKLHEEVVRASAPELAAIMRERGELKGEVVIVVAPPGEEELEQYEIALAAGASCSGEVTDPDESLRADIADALAAGEPPSAIAKRLSQKYSRRKRDVYGMVLEVGEAS